MTAEEFSAQLAELIADAHNKGLSFEAIVAELRETAAALEEALS